jgi:hypothetical protein
MAIILTDADIARLLAEPKPSPADYQTRLQLRAKIGHKKRELHVTVEAVRREALGCGFAFLTISHKKPKRGFKEACGAAKPDQSAQTAAPGETVIPLRVRNRTRRPQEADPKAMLGSWCLRDRLACLFSLRTPARRGYHFPVERKTEAAGNQRGFSSRSRDASRTRSPGMSVETTL